MQRDGRDNQPTRHRRRQGPELMGILLALSAAFVLLLSWSRGAPSFSGSTSAVGQPPAPMVTLKAARAEACACSIVTVASSSRAWREELARGGAGRAPFPGGVLVPPEVASAGAARTGMWIMHNKELLERDPRGFLRLMSYQARRHEPRLTRLPGEGPMAKPGPAVAETPPPVLPVIQQGPR